MVLYKIEVETRGDDEGVEERDAGRKGKDKRTQGSRERDEGEKPSGVERDDGRKEGKSSPCENMGGEGEM